MIEIYTDGAISKNGKEHQNGGAAFVALLQNNEGYAYSETVPNATNNICELLAILRACEYVDKVRTGFEQIFVYSDSAYCVRCFEEKWYRAWQRNGWITASKTPVKNKEIWEKLIPYFEDFRFTLKKVKGHSGDKFNDYVDKLAVDAKNKKIISEKIIWGKLNESCCC